MKSDEQQPDLEGMTLAERLFATGLMARWDAAIQSEDRAEVLRILSQVKVSNPHATADAVLLPSIQHRL